MWTLDIFVGNDMKCQLSYKTLGEYNYLIIYKSKLRRKVLESKNKSWPSPLKKL